ncbi:MAG: AraC family transcriptional regulator ligand-binding domain-containing protein [Pseudomonadota bacterium]|nr:AraC family transcriptional regulator ligand-binding domain-containing protein [Pseudomonadota bacterium]MEC8430536.1 AraC family transcriptional regulator ligand-binding domain-containing protein [Pseudomonadota bacterium]MEE3087622.1 AraC family transcriptional regulator ligand-binding domain-containing protein [Pseudomonadota bacterium]|tara:strand:- start:230 stop:1228 length:999 start_codon:yes stop_codon:yes gene_type:complete
MSVVYASSLAIIDKLTEALGVPFEALADAADINIGLLNTPDAVLPVANFLRLHDEILLQTGNEDFGLLCGRIIYMESFHLYMSLAAASHTFRDWINLIPEINPTLGGMMKNSVRRRGDHLILELEFDRPSKLKRCLLTDSHLASTVMLMDGFSVLPVRPVRVDLSYPQPEDTQALKEMFRAPLYFNQAASAIYYNKGILDLPQLHVSTSLYDNVQEELDEFLGHFSWGADAFTTNLYTVVRRQLLTGTCTVNSVAKQLHISSRTLQLRLQERDTQFRLIVQQLRSTLAAKYLQDRQLRIIDIALLLGYRDAKAFSVAFKSWYGCPPSEYRRQ